MGLGAKCHGVALRMFFGRTIPSLAIARLASVAASHPESRPSYGAITRLVERSTAQVDAMLAPSKYTARRHGDGGLQPPIHVLPSFSAIEQQFDYVPRHDRPRGRSLRRISQLGAPQPKPQWQLPLRCCKPPERHDHHSPGSVRPRDKPAPSRAQSKPAGLSYVAHRYLPNIIAFPASLVSTGRSRCPADASVRRTSVSCNRLRSASIAG